MTTFASQEKHHVVPNDPIIDDPIHLIEKAYFNNLLLLGIDIDEYNELYGLVVSDDMFRTVNIKGMQYILYFLFTKIFEDHFNIFKSVWPILDKKQASQFKSVVKDLLKKLENEGRLPQGTSRVSYLQTCHGEMFCKMIWKVSNVALKAQLDLMKYPTPHLPGLFDANSQSFTAMSSLLNHMDIVKRSTKSHINIQTKRFLENVNKMSNSEKQWKECSDALISEYRTVMEEKCQLDKKIQRITSIEKAFKSEEKEMSIDKASILQFWEKLLGFIQNHRKHMQTIDNITKNKSNEHCVNGHNLIVDEDDHSEVDISKLIQSWNSSITETFLKLQDLLISKKLLNDNESDHIESPITMLENLKKFKLQHRQQSSIIKQSIEKLRQDILKVETSIQQLRGSTENSPNGPIYIPNRKPSLNKPSYSTPRTNFHKLIPPTPKYDNIPFQSPGVTMTPSSKHKTSIYNVDKNELMYDYSFDDEDIIEEISSNVKNTVLNQK